MCHPRHGASVSVDTYSIPCVRRAEKFIVAGHELWKVALPAAYVVDLQEACKLIGIPASGTMFPDLDCMVTKHELADPHGSIRAV